jgi:biopolymer transport protein ExbB/TolQ
MIERITHLMIESGAAWVLWLLFVLSGVSVAIALERAWVFGRAKGEVATLVPRLRRLLRTDPPAALKLLEASRSVESRVVSVPPSECANSEKTRIILNIRI